VPTNFKDVYFSIVLRNNFFQREKKTKRISYVYVPLKHESKLAKKKRKLENLPLRDYQHRNYHSTPAFPAPCWEQPPRCDRASAAPRTHLDQQERKREVMYTQQA